MIGRETAVRRTVVRGGGEERKEWQKQSALQRSAFITLLQEVPHRSRLKVVGLVGGMH